MRLRALVEGFDLERETAFALQQRILTELPDDLHLDVDVRSSRFGHTVTCRTPDLPNEKFTVFVRDASKVNHSVPSKPSASDVYSLADVEAYDLNHISGFFLRKLAIKAGFLAKKFNHGYLKVDDREYTLVGTGDGTSSYKSPLRIIARCPSNDAIGKLIIYAIIQIYSATGLAKAIEWLDKHDPDDQKIHELEFR